MQQSQQPCNAPPAGNQSDTFTHAIPTHTAPAVDTDQEEERQKNERIRQQQMIKLPLHAAQIRKDQEDVEAMLAHTILQSKVQEISRQQIDFSNVSPAVSFLDIFNHNYLYAFLEV